MTSPASPPAIITPASHKAIVVLVCALTDAVLAVAVANLPGLGLEVNGVVLPLSLIHIWQVIDRRQIVCPQHTLGTDAAVAVVAAQRRQRLAQHRRC